MTGDAFPTEPVVYFSVPDWHGYGPEFSLWEDAYSFAERSIREIDGCPGSFTRAWVIVRVKDATGDREIYRTEVTRS